MQPVSDFSRLYGVMSQISRTYSAHIGSLYSLNYWMATSGLTDSFFTEAVKAGVSKSTAVAYRADAARLWLRTLTDSNNGKMMGDVAAFVDENEVFQIYRALLAVHTSSHYTAELVTRQHRIHTVANPNIDRLAVIFNKKTALFGGSGRLIDVQNVDLQNILTKYNLIVSKYYLYNEDCDGVTIFAQKPMNMAAIAKEIEAIEGIEYVENITDDNHLSDIRAVRSTQGWLLEYCLHTNEKPIAWLFEVTHSGHVFVKDDGYMPHARTAKGYTPGATR
jgi:hypothetical protein